MSASKEHLRRNARAFSKRGTSASVYNKASIFHICFFIKPHDEMNDPQLEAKLCDRQVLDSETELKIQLLSLQCAVFVEK